ncbi:MAG: hypothetical protein P8Y98_15580 [Anaerolineales bacterium]|jgi:hypothetical protein
MEVDSQAHQVQVDAFISRLIRKWPILLAFGLLGAFIGFGVSDVRKPRYEAGAKMGINIQYGVIEPLELVVEDRAQNRVADVILADSTLQQILDNVSQTVRQEQGWNDPADLRRSLRLDRGLSSWGLVVRNQDPVLAAEISNLWLDISLSELERAQDHAWQAVALMGDEPFHLECDQYLLTSEPSESYAWRCDLDPITLDSQALSGELRTEIDLSRGILPVFSFDALNAAQVPQTPVLYSRGVMLLSGACIGLFVGLWFLLVFPRKRAG